MDKRLDPNDYTIAWIAVLPVEERAAIAVLDNVHDGKFPSKRNEDFLYTGGDVNGHNVVIATLPKGTVYGGNTAATLVSQVKARFPKLWFSLLVGVAAGLPNLSPKDGSKPRDIRLGDVLVSVPDQNSSGIIQYDLAKDTGNEYSLVGRLAETAPIVRAAIGKIENRMKRPFKEARPFAKYIQELRDKVKGDDNHEDDNGYLCPSQDKDVLLDWSGDGTNDLQSKPTERPLRDESERTRVWYGLLGSGNTLMRNHKRRDQLRDNYNVIGLEMEAAGVMNSLPAGVIRGVCDYGDNSKNKEWQSYAAAVAAVYAKGILYQIDPDDDDVTRG